MTRRAWYTWLWTAAGNEVTIPDIMAANGVIHGIDGVIIDVSGGHSLPDDMMPKDDVVIGNIPAVLAAYPGDIFSTLLAAVTAADLAGALDSAGPFTLFAPTNAAFGKYLAAAGSAPPPLSDVLARLV